MAGDTRRAAPTRRGKPGPEDVDRHVGAMLRARRLQLGLSQQQLGERVGTTYQQLHKYEAGANRISAGRLFLLAEALEVGVGHLFQGLGTAGPAPSQPRTRQMLELARSFAALSRRQQEALAELARALANGGPGEEAGTGAA